jgi:hypothetical protein
VPPSERKFCKIRLHRGLVAYELRGLTWTVVRWRPSSRRVTGTSPPAIPVPQLDVAISAVYRTRGYPAHTAGGWKGFTTAVQGLCRRDRLDPRTVRRRLDKLLEEGKLSLADVTNVTA